MGFVLTLLYIALSLLSPRDLLPSLVEYRVELLVVALAVIVSLPNVLDGRFYRIPQNYLLMGLFAAVFLSVAIGVSWLGGGFLGVQKFLTVSVVFYLVVLNCQSIRRLKILVLLVVMVGGLYVVRGAQAYYAGERNIENVCSPNYDERTPVGRLVNIQGNLEVCNPLLVVIPLSDGTFALRMRGLGLLKDPNDFAQLLVMLIPLIWLMWRRDRHIQNLLLVMAPTMLLVWGMYLTHSRGGMVALVVILMLALRTRTNLVTALLAGVLVFGGMTALNFSGGRDISLQAGSNRFALWGDGLALFKSAPAFGVGYENFANANRGQTAHNSFIVCLAELGLFGYGFWVALIVFTISGLNSLVATIKMRRSHSAPLILEDGSQAELDPGDVELKRWAESIRLSLAAFLVAGFFLSRAYALTLYLALGMAVVITLLASEDEESVSAQPLWRQFGLSAGAGFAMIVFVYMTLRFANALALGNSGSF